ncbi:OmpA family protein [Edaphocola aurantiacus]|jgi:outer membrane protein OmpA-like peptidoglycan-associated protein|uniref:OmpA family protein n=1 Tax=Edaphocola aurantiacus TaxID=2601682 RepID=UPI001C945097|nr:OmpA family protein [Edaphocola aurantiacus]
MKRKPILLLATAAIAFASVQPTDVLAQQRDRDKYGKRADDPVAKLGYEKKLRWADGLFKDGSFYNAEEYYKQLQMEQPRNPYLAYQIAESQWRMRDYANAAASYGYAYSLAKAIYPEAIFKQALMLKMNGSYNEAIGAFQQFKKDNPKPNKDIKILLKQTETEIKGCYLGIKSIANPEAATVAQLGPNINSANTELSPFPLGDTALLFGTMNTNIVVDKIKEKRSDYVSRFMVSQKNKYTDVKDTFTWAVPFMDGQFNDPKYHVGNGVLAEGGDRFYFTKCLDQKGDTGMMCRIFVAEFKNDRWGAPQELGNGINESGSSSTHPCIVKIGKKEILFFTSDRKLQSRGGYDIWYSVYDSRLKTYRRPQNVGKQINTKGDEMTPYFDNRTNKLYFSSNGWETMGGLDVFEATMAGNSPSRYSGMKNMGYPINTPADDMYFILDGYGKPDGYVVSNRVGSIALKNPTCCDDIFRVQFEPKLKALGKVIDAKTQKPVGEVVVKMVDENGNLNTFNSVDGNFEFNTPRGHSYTFTADKPKYTSSHANVNTEAVQRTDKDNTVEVEIYVNQIDLSWFRMDNVFYDDNKYDLRPESVSDLEKLISLMNDNPSLSVKVASHTDSRGSDEYNKTLSQKRAESVVNYLVNKGGIDRSRLEAEGFGETMPVAPNETNGKPNLAGQQLNRRTEFKIMDEDPTKRIIFDSSKPGTIGSQEKNLNVDNTNVPEEVDEKSSLGQPGSRVNK